MVCLSPQKENGYVDALLICNSNMFIPVVLTELLRNQNCRYLIISDIDNIKRFFELLALPNLIYYHYGYHPHDKGYLSFIDEKKKLWNHISGFNIGKVVFFHAEYGEMANWLIKKLSKNIPVYYCKLFDSIPAPRAPFSLKKLRVLAAQRLLWGVNMEVLYKERAFPSLPESFFKNVGAEIITMPVERELNNTYLKGVLKSYNISGDIVLLTGTIVQDRIYSEEEYTCFIDELITVIGQDRIVSKCHPRYKDLCGREQLLEQIPSFIPGNVLLDSFDYFIGVESTLLVEAAMAGKKAVSIIDLLKPEDKLRKTFHDFFDNRLKENGVILFPRTMEELISIVH